LLVTSDHDGRFHVACAAIPNADRGSNFVMKVDERTLPSGYRLTTENPRDVRVTRGKMVKLNFGATVHRVVRLELSGAAFTSERQHRVAARLPRRPCKSCLTQLAGRPSVLRIAYRRGARRPALPKNAWPRSASEYRPCGRKDAKRRTCGRRQRTPPSLDD
jgi:hypothetical protein